MLRPHADRLLRPYTTHHGCLVGYFDSLYPLPAQHPAQRSTTSKIRPPPPVPLQCVHVSKPNSVSWGSKLRAGPVPDPNHDSAVLVPCAQLIIASYFSVFIVGVESLIAYKINIFCVLSRQCAAATVTLPRTLPCSNAMLLVRSPAVCRKCRSAVQVLSR